MSNVRDTGIKAFRDAIPSYRENPRGRIVTSETLQP